VGGGGQGDGSERKGAGTCAFVSVWAGRGNRECWGRKGKVRVYSSTQTGLGPNKHATTIIYCTVRRCSMLLCWHHPPFLTPLTPPPTHHTCIW